MNIDSANKIIKVLPTTGKKNEEVNECKINK